ncbi:putative nuclease HARBI1 [Diorhabda sublineata]|uniref:putative nuclease HARBI1 n=1 Tax=Diorhabda sublineata TaxID=1163346 RepID=UPI0024E07D22|nr:putative nuclease HARBI1 [Diorhabda sublineata]
MDQAKADWASKFLIPTVIGAVDCTHVHIMKPSEFGDEYVNRKGKITINIQITCDANEKITIVDVQWPGSVHDGRISRVSRIQDVVRRYDGDVCLLGDSGYGITPWLLTPFDESRNAREKNHNSTHAQERVIIERVFGQMKRRFPILSSQVRTPVKNVPNLVISCRVLHNVAKHFNDAWEEEDGIENGVAEENVPLYNLDRNEVINRRRGHQKRLEISNNLMM